MSHFLSRKKVGTKRPRKAHRNPITQDEHDAAERRVYALEQARAMKLKAKQDALMDLIKEREAEKADTTDG